MFSLMAREIWNEYLKKRKCEIIGKYELQLHGLFKKGVL